MSRGCWLCKAVIDPGGVLCRTCVDRTEDEREAGHSDFWRERARVSRKVKKYLKEEGRWVPKTFVRRSHS